MTSFNHLPRISRRTTLKWLGASIAGFALPKLVMAEKLVLFSSTAKGYGTDPDLKHPIAPWERIMTRQQLQLTAVLADMLLPAQANFPSPSALGIQDFVDEWVSAPYPEQLRDRLILLGGFASINKSARSRWGKRFLDISNSARQEIFEGLVAQWRKEEPPAAQNTFFYRFRYVVLGAYYTTTEGYDDIGYSGNVPLATYPNATDQERTILDREFKKLGLVAPK
jgi:Gluconate 2-dehydrogenase subunit 3